MFGSWPNQLYMASAYPRIEVPLRVEGRPSHTHDVSGVEGGAGEAAPAGLRFELALHGELVDAILAEGPPGVVLSRGDARGVPVRPGGAAYEEVPRPPPQGADQRLLAQRREADHVDDRVRLERRDGLAERAALLLGCAVDAHRSDARPRRVRRVRLALAP